MEWQGKDKLILCRIYTKLTIYNLIGLVLDIIGLILGNSHQKETQLDYKTERILNIVGIVISIIIWIAGILLTMNGFM